jgi:hypothetical protein
MTSVRVAPSLRFQAPDFNRGEEKEFFSVESPDFNCGEILNSEFCILNSSQ